MKVRRGFVSNSSSSSFVVVGSNINLTHENGDLTPFIKSGVLVIGDDAGETEYGWQEDCYVGAGDKVNLAWILTEGEWWADHRERLIKTIKKAYPTVEYILFEADHAYADHQSVGDMRDPIFDSDESIYNFLFATDSEINTDNDNH